MGISKFLSVEGSTDSNLLYQAKTCVPVSNLAHFFQTYNLLLLHKIHNINERNSISNLIKC